MTLEEAKQEIPDLKTYFSMDCEDCQNDYYCPSECNHQIKARRLGINKIQSAYARYNGDLYEVANYVRRASV